MLRANKLLFAFLSLALVSFLVLGSGSLLAAEKKEASKPEKKEKSVSALKVGKDPADKQLREISKQDDKVLSERIRETLKNYPKHEAKTRSDGTKSLVIAPEFLNFSVAMVGADGKVKHTCSKGEKPHTDQKQIHAEVEPEE